jgi:hypothetical protein
MKPIIVRDEDAEDFVARVAIAIQDAWVGRDRDNPLLQRHAAMAAIRVVREAIVPMIVPGITGERLHAEIAAFLDAALK